MFNFHCTLTERSNTFSKWHNHPYHPHTHLAIFLIASSFLLWSSLILGSIEIEPVSAQANLPVFPGAQGFGTNTIAGRGGQIIKVTNLNDTGPGSLRAAVEASGPRIVVFEVSGTITLSRDVSIANPYITIAGQTAPSPGITLKNFGIAPSTHDILIQHIRVRVGDQGGDGDVDAIGDIFNSKRSEVYNIVLDHLSLGWSNDEIIGSYASNLTISDSILSEALHDANHYDGKPHSKAVLVGENSKNVSIIRNLFAHNNDRNPYYKGDTSGTIINNVIYDGGAQTDILNVGQYGETLPQKVYYAVVGNRYIKGLSWNDPNIHSYVVRVLDIPPGSKLYHTDNLADSPLRGFRVMAASNAAGGSNFNPTVSSWPAELPAIAGLNPMAAKDVEEYVSANAGARPMDRDAVDIRILNQLKNRTGKWINSQSEVGGWPALAVNQRTFNIPSDPSGDSDNDGYTNIEEVLHQMAAEVEGKAAPAPAPSVNSFYVSTTGSDSNSCATAQNINTPKRTLNNAVKCLSAGRTLYVRGGTYKESLVNGIIPPGDSWNNPVIIAAYPGETVIMRPDPGAIFIFQFIGPQKYIIIDGLVLDGANISHDVIKITWATATGYSHHIRIANSEVMNSQKNSGCTKISGNKGNFGPCGMGMLITVGSDYNEFINLKVHDNGKTDFDHGIYIGSHNNLIENSSFYNNAGWGIHKYPAGDNNIIRNNKIYNNARDGFRGVGIGMYGGTGNLVEGNTVYGNKDGIGAQYGERNLTISNNTIYNNSGYGIYSEAPNTTLRDNKVSQNGKDFGGTTITAPVESPPPVPEPTPSSAPVVSLGSTSFNGSSDFVKVNTANFFPNQGSISTVVSASSFKTTPQYIFGHTTLPAYANRIQLYTDDVGGNLDLGLGNNHTTHLNIQPLQPNTWYHIALVWNSGKYFVYVDGTQKATGSYSGLANFNTYAHSGGNGYDPNPQSWAGVIDNTKIYNYALSSSEVKSIYDGITPVPVYSPQDLNQDGKVNLLDVLLLISDFGKTSGFNPAYDLNQDGLINILDVLEVARRWG